MGYRDDGFFNINWSQDARNAGPTSGGKQNPPFLFPDKSIRFLDAQAELQKKFNTFLSDTVSRGDYQIHRGYIRNLEQPQFGNVPISRCNFQFNPQEIRQSVSMREDIYLPLLQDTAQLQQPVGAVVNFTFDLLFDRSHELSKGSLITGNLATPNEDVDPLNPNPEKDAYDIGVLADLRVLYSVIGQGFSREMLEFQKSRLIDFAETQSGSSGNSDSEGTSDSTDTTEGSTTVTNTASALGKIDDAALNEILEANYGNWGLLMPNPVRVMFSSLFMLDGFITGTNVDFLKFNTKMVPLMCRVTMNMSALYIGFARQDTFLTRQFKDAAEAQKEERRQREATRAEILKALSLTGSRFTIATALDNEALADWDEAVRNKKKPLPVWTLVTADTAGLTGPSITEGRAILLGFPQIIPKEGGYDETLPDGTVVRRGNDTDYVLKLFEEGLTFTISYTWDISIYGGINESGSLSESEAKAALSSKSYTKGNTIKLVGKYSGTETASSKEEWGSGKSGDGVKAARVRRRSIRGGRNNNGLPNQAIGDYALHKNYTIESDLPGWVKSSYYIIEYTLTVSINYGGSEDVSISKSYAEVYSGNSNFRKESILSWNGLQNDSDVPYVRAGNLSDPEPI